LVEASITAVFEPAIQKIGYADQDYTGADEHEDNSGRLARSKEFDHRNLSLSASQQGRRENRSI